MPGKRNIIVQSWNTLPAPAQLGIVVVGGFSLYKTVVQPQIDKWKIRRDQRKEKKYNVPVVVTNGDGTGYRQTINLATSAGIIYDAFYNNDPMGWTEDETRAIAELKKIPQGMIPQLTEAYREVYSKDLKKDFIKFVDSDEWEKIDYLFK